MSRVRRRYVAVAEMDVAVGMGRCSVKHEVRCRRGGSSGGGDQ